MTKTILEFEKEFIKNRKMSMDVYRDYWVTLDCKCEESTCPGYAVVNRTPEAILKHVINNWSKKAE